MKRKIIYYIIMIIILITLLSTILLLLYRFIEKKSYGNYIPINDRESFIIHDVNENLLQDYIYQRNSVIVFWASWCHYCVEEAEELNNFIISNPKIPVIIVSHDTERNEVEEFLTQNNYNWFVIFDKEKTIRENLDPNSSGIPSTYILNRNFEIINFYKGPLSEKEFLDLYNQKEIFMED